MENLTVFLLVGIFLKLCSESIFKLFLVGTSFFTAYFICLNICYFSELTELTRKETTQIVSKIKNKKSLENFAYASNPPPAKEVENTPQLFVQKYNQADDDRKRVETALTQAEFDCGQDDKKCIKSQFYISLAEDKDLQNSYNRVRKLGE